MSGEILNTQGNILERKILKARLSTILNYAPMTCNFFNETVAILS